MKNFSHHWLVWSEEASVWFLSLILDKFLSCCWIHLLSHLPSFLED